MKSFLIRDILSSSAPPEEAENLQHRRLRVEAEDDDDDEDVEIEDDVDEDDDDDDQANQVKLVKVGNLTDCDGQATTSSGSDKLAKATSAQEQQHFLNQQIHAQFQQLNSPLDALFQMTSSTFDALKRGEKRKASNESSTTTSFTTKQNPKKKRKSRTAFTNSQIYELERRFRMQKYLSPTDRDEIAMTLNLSNAQVITWFQNRRAKMKRDLEEQRRDIETASFLTMQKTLFDALLGISQMKTPPVTKE